MVQKKDTAKKVKESDVGEKGTRVRTSSNKKKVSKERKDLIGISSLKPEDRHMPSSSQMFQERHHPHFQRIQPAQQGHPEFQSSRPSLEKAPLQWHNNSNAAPRASIRAPRPRTQSMPLPERSMLQQACIIALTTDPLVDSDEENPDEFVRRDYIRRLQVISRLRGKPPTPEPQELPPQSTTRNVFPSEAGHAAVA